MANMAQKAVQKGSSRKKLILLQYFYDLHMNKTKSFPRSVEETLAHRFTETWPSDKSLTPFELSQD